MVATEHLFSNTMDDGRHSDSSDQEEEDEEDVSSMEEEGEDEEDLAPRHQGVLEDDDSCPVCLNEFVDQQIGVPNSCEHAFCVDCILEWSKNSNSCPVDRIVFESVSVYRRFAGRFLRTVAIAAVEAPVEEEEEDLTFCQVCGSAENEDTLLLCDGCDQGYHCACLTPPLDEVPHGEWFCIICGPNHEPPVMTTSHVERTSHGLGRTRATERVRAHVSEARLRHSRIGGLEQQIDAIVNEILVGAGRRFHVVELPPDNSRRRATSRTPRKKRSKSRRKTSSKRRKSNKRGKKTPRKGSKCRGSGGKNTAKSPGRTAAAAAFRRPLSMFGGEGDLDEYLARDNEETPSYLIAQKHRQLAQSALRLNTPLPSMLTLGSRLAAVQRPPLPAPEPVPDLLGSILSGQEVLMTPSNNISIQRGGALHVNKPVCSRAPPPSCKLTVNRNGLPGDKPDDHFMDKKKPNVQKGGNVGRKAAVSPDKDDSSGKPSTASTGGDGGATSSSHPRGSSNGASGGDRDPGASSAEAAGDDGAGSNPLGNGGDEFFDDSDIRRNVKKRAPLKRFNLMKQEPDEAPANPRGGFKRKIQIKKVFNLPKNPNEAQEPETAKEPEVYDPFDPTEDDEAGNVEMGENEDIYDPFQPTVSDEELSEGDAPEEVENSPPVFSKFAPPEVKVSDIKKEEQKIKVKVEKSPSPECESGEVDDKTIDTSIPEQQRASKSSDVDDSTLLTDFEVDELLEGNLDAATCDGSKHKKEKPSRRVSPEIDMFAEAELSLDPEDATPPPTGPTDPSSAWREKVRSLSTVQESDGVVKLPGFKSGNAAATPVQFKKLKRVKSAEEIGKAFSDTKEKGGSVAVVVKLEKIEEHNVKKEIVSEPHKTLSEKHEIIEKPGHSSDGKEAMPEARSEERSRKKKKHSKSPSLEGQHQSRSRSPLRDEARSIRKSEKRKKRSRSRSVKRRDESHSPQSGGHRSRSRPETDGSRDRSSRKGRRSRSTSRNGRTANKRVHSKPRHSNSPESRSRRRSSERHRKKSRSTSRKRSQERRQINRKSRSGSRKRSARRKSPERRTRKTSENRSTRRSPCRSRRRSTSRSIIHSPSPSRKKSRSRSKQHSVSRSVRKSKRRDSAEQSHREVKQEEAAAPAVQKESPVTVPNSTSAELGAADPVKTKKHKKKKKHLEEGELPQDDDTVFIEEEIEIEPPKSSKKKKKDKHRKEEGREERHEEVDRQEKSHKHHGRLDVEFIEIFPHEMPKRHRHSEGKSRHDKGDHGGTDPEQKVVRVVDDDVADFLGLMNNDREAHHHSENERTVKESKKKKKKKRSHDVTEASDGELVELQQSSSKKKRRRQTTETTEDVIFEEVHTSLEKKKSHKKKRSHHSPIPIATEWGDESPSKLLEEAEEASGLSHKSKFHRKRKIHKSAEHLEEEMETLKKTRKKKKKHKEKAAEDEFQNLIYEMVVPKQKSKKKKKSDKRRLSREDPPDDESGDNLTGLVEDVENPPDCVRESMQIDHDRRKESVESAIQDDVDSVDVDAELEDALVTHKKHKKKKKHHHSNDEIPEIRHADLTRMLSSHELDEDQRALISPIHTPKPASSQSSKIDDNFYSELLTPKKVELPPDVKNDGDEMYSPTAALSPDLSPPQEDMRSPSPLSPSSLSPEPNSLSVEVSSQEIKETLAEEFLEQSRKRWNERKRAPGLNTSFSTCSSSEIPGLGLVEDKSKHQDRNFTAVKPSAPAAEDHTSEEHLTDIAKTEEQVTVPAPLMAHMKGNFASPLASTPVLCEDIFADSPVLDTDARQEPVRDFSIQQVDDLHKLQSSSLETSLTSQTTSVETSATSLPTSQASSTEDAEREEIETAVVEDEKASAQLVKEHEIVLEDDPDDNTNELPSAGTIELEKEKPEAKYETKRRSHSSDRRRSRQKSRSPRRESRTRKADKETSRDEDRRAKDDRSRRRRSRSPRRGIDTGRSRSRRSPRRRSRSKSPRKEKDQRNRTSSPRNRYRSKSPYSKTRKSRSRSPSKNSRKDRRRNTPSPPAKRQDRHARSPVSAFRSTAESLVFSAKKKDNTHEDAGPQPIATISGLSGADNGHCGTHHHAMQDHHHDLGEDEFIPHGLMMKSNQSSALRTLIEVPTGSVQDPRAQAKNTKTSSLIEIPTTSKPAIKLSSRTLANMPSKSPAATITPAVTEYSKSAKNQVCLITSSTHVVETSPPKSKKEMNDTPLTPPPPPPPPLSSKPRTPPMAKTEIPGLSFINESGEKDPEVYSPTDAFSDDESEKGETKSSAEANVEQPTEEEQSVLNPTQILNFIGLNPQQKSAAQNAIMSFAELSKRLQLGQITKSEKSRRRSHKEADGLSPVSIDNIESSAVDMYNKGKESGLIQKLQFQERVVEEAKLAIKPYYERREISKLEYKEIMKRAVNKICTSGTSEVNNIKIRRLIRRYIEKYQQKNSFKKEKMRSKLDGKLEHATAMKPHSPSPPPYQPLTPPHGSERQDTEGHKLPVDTPSLLKREPRKIVTLPDLPLPPPPPPPRPSHMM